MAAMQNQTPGSVDLESLATFGEALRDADRVDAAFTVLTAFGESLGFSGVIARREREGGEAADVFQSLPQDVEALFGNAEFLRAWPITAAAMASALPVSWTVADWPGDRHTAARMAMGRAARVGVEGGVTFAVRGPWGRTMVVTALCRAHRLLLLRGVDLDLWSAAAARFLARLGELAPDPQRPLDLSRRELEILRLSAQGLTGTAAAAALGVTEATVKFHLAGARRKLGVKNTTEAIARLTAIGRGGGSAK